MPLIVLSACQSCVWHFAGNAFYHRVWCASRAYDILLEMPLIVVCNVFQERLAFYGKCLGSSWVHDWGASATLRQMPLIVVSDVFQERVAFCGICFFIVVYNVFQERLAFYGKCLWSSWVHVWGASGILREMTFIVICNVSQDRLAFCRKCLLSSFLVYLKGILHFTANAIDRPEFMFEERLAFCGKCLLLVVCNLFQERLAFYCNCLWSWWVHVWRSSCILRHLHLIVVCNVFQERLAFYGKCV